MDLTLDQLTDLSAPAPPQKAIWRIITLCCGYILSIQILSSVTDQSKLTFLRSIFQQQCFVYVQPCMLLHVSYSSLHIQPRSRLSTYSALTKHCIFSAHSFWCVLLAMSKFFHAVSHLLFPFVVTWLSVRVFLVCKCHLKDGGTCCNQCDVSGLDYEGSGEGNIQIDWKGSVRS